MLYLGLDAGGSKTKLVGRLDGDPGTITIDGDGANLQRLGLQAAASVLAEMVKEAIRIADQPGEVSICAGVAGAGRRSEQDALAERLQSLVSDWTETPPRVFVVHDAEIAIEAAFHGESGIIVIAGTGSVGFARRPGGRLERVGGWGYLLGDEGSGHTIAIRGLGAICAAYDGGPKTELVERARSEFGIASTDDVITKVYSGDWVLQEAARLVVDAAEDGDVVALSILREQARLLTTQIEWLHARCPDVEHRMALIGGLAGVPFYQDILCETLLQRFPGWEILRNVDAPVYGALRLAEKAVVGSGA